MSDVVDPCSACDRFVRATDSACPFCGAAHAAASLPPKPPLRSRLAMVASALLLGACGGGDVAVDDTDDGAGSGGEVVDEGGDGAGVGGEGGDGAEGDAEIVDGDESFEPQPSCAGVCGSHHTPTCDDPPCPAPPYGAPPADDLIV